MKKIGLVSLALLAAVAAFPSLVIAAPVAPFVEDFATTSANWTDGAVVLATYVPSGGPDGSSYASVSATTQGIASGSSNVLFRGQDETNASGNAFVGDWLGGGIIRFSAYVHHNAPVSLPYFVRFATPSNFPGVTSVNDPLVAPNTWTKIEWYINPSNPALAPEGPPSFFNTAFSNIGHIQIGYNVPASLANSQTSYTYNLDQVTVSNVPEPASCLLAFGGLVGAALIRRRSRS